jgi:LmbE family N-acetylglucosaminyl deacetylase
MSFRLMLRPLALTGAAVLQDVWAAGFGAAGRLARRRARRWSSPGGLRVLIVAPHPDDEAMGCAGTALLHVRSGDRVFAAIATDGRRSRVGADPSEVSDLRRREADAAAILMRAERFAWIGLPEGEWRVPQLQSALRTQIEEILPHVIYAPSRIDFHPEHFQVAHALALALRDLDPASVAATRVRVYQVQVPLGPPLVNLVADVSLVQHECERVLQAYTSQAGSIRCSYRQRRYGAVWHRITGTVEEFWELSAQEYSALHVEPPHRWRRAFRGLRRSPLADPLAYLAGSTERRRIAAAVQLPVPSPNATAR